MSEKTRNTRYPQGRIDTVIGAGVHIDGRVTFTGVLRLDGEARGDILCEADGNGTIVVGKGGNVAGTIRAPHIIVGGRVAGPVHSSGLIEIQSGASVVGDVSYKDIEVHAGGLIDGALVQAGPVSETGVSEHAAPISAAGERPGRGLKLGATAVLLAVVVAITVVMWAKRDPEPLAPPLAKAVPGAEQAAAAASTVPSAPPGSGAPQDKPGVVAGDALSPEPAPGAEAGPAAEAPADPTKVLVVQGVNPAKPAGVVLVMVKEPSVLFKKKRNDPGDGARIDVAQGATTSISIARNDVLRVGNGRDVTLFYQGRKVAPKAIESGAWMSFVPQSAGATVEEK